MLRFAANIGRLFAEHPFMERFDRAAAAGFRAVEYPEPYGYDVRAIRSALTLNGLEQAHFNLPWGTWPQASGESRMTPGAGPSSGTTSSGRWRSPISSSARA